MKILYLDYDGVVHHEECFFHPKKGIYLKAEGHTLFEWAPILADLLAPHPEVQIVLSTSWVPNRSFNYAKYRLPKTLQDRVIDATFHRGHHDRPSFLAMPRGQQIAADVLRRSPQSWFAIDDDAVDWPDWCRNNLIETNGATGLSDPGIQYAVKTMLERF
jgi:hypothetical protein